MGEKWKTRVEDLDSDENKRELHPAAEIRFQGLCLCLRAGNIVVVV